ncbi:MAG: Gx transporter family protein [Oscillospiraceae bacterium]
MYYKKIKKITTIGVLASLSFALSFFEATVLSAFILVPGIKIGLSNIVTMFTFVLLGFIPAFYLTMLKVLFTFVSRGFTASLMSFGGSVLSLFTMFLFYKLLKSKEDFLPISILGGVTHNIGQIIMATIILGSDFVFYYIPVLLISGLVVGVFTGIIFNNMPKNIKYNL